MLLQGVIPPVVLDLQGAKQSATLVKSLGSGVVPIDQIQQPQRCLRRLARKPAPVANLITFMYERYWVRVLCLQPMFLRLVMNSSSSSEKVFCLVRATTDLMRSSNRIGRALKLDRN